MASLELIVGLVVLMTLTIVGMMVLYAARYKRIPPDHAMVLYGRKYAGGKGFAVWTGGGKFIVPIVESYALISLEPMEFDLLVEDVVANVLAPPDQVRRFQVSVTAIAKVSDDVNRLQASAAMLLHKTREELRSIIAKTIEGHVRGILATEQRPEADLDAVAERVRSLADSDLANMGLEVRSLSLRIRDAEPIRAPGAGALDNVNRELHHLDLRIRRIEERLGLTPPA